MTRVIAFVAAFLLFAAQPLAGKWLLPDFGGAPAVWIACLLVFQGSVILGYASAGYVLRCDARRAQRCLSVGLILALLSLIGIGHPLALADTFAAPWTAFAAILAVSVWIAPTAALLAITSPLLQAARAREGDEQPYRLSAWSNAGSLSGLLAYPLLIEPTLTRHAQGWLLASGTLAVGIALLMTLRKHQLQIVPSSSGPLLWRWWLLPALGTILLAGHTNVLCQEIAPVPLMWVLPLSVYLLSWIVPFAYPRAYHRSSAVLAAILSVGVGVWLRFETTSPDAWLRAISDLATLAAGCWCCHGELAALRPPPERLTRFWTISALGGALGSALVVIAAPWLLTSYDEHRLALAVVISTAALAPRLATIRKRWPLVLASLSFLAIAIPASRSGTHADGTLYATRTFFGVLAVRESKVLGQTRRELRHGATVHGVEMRDGTTPPLPSAYYGASSGLGEVFMLRRQGPPLRIAAVGLGIGTLAAWLRTEDSAVIAELDPAVTRLAQTWFTYLATTAGKISIRHGDGRRVFAADEQRYDLIILDAFSGDAVPAHLLTREAFAVWQQRLAPGGVVCVHISNRHVDLAPVVRAAADNHGWQHRLIEDEPDIEDRARCESSTWVLCGAEAAEVTNEHLDAISSVDTGVRDLWTDDRADVLSRLTW